VTWRRPSYLHSPVGVCPSIRGERIDAEMGFVDPAPSRGFEIERLPANQRGEVTSQRRVAR